MRRNSLRLMPFVIIFLFISVAFLTDSLGAGVVKSELFLRSPVLEPRQMIVILGGYTPPGDPYRQLPSHFVEKWELKNRLLDLRSDILLLNCGTSIYTLPETKELAAHIEKRVFPGQTIVLVGVSTGVEGIIKVLPYLKKKVRALICISGTYDLFSLDTGSGEYKIHSAVLGPRTDAWKANNPISILEMMKKNPVPRIYAFSEEKSIYLEQLRLLTKRAPKRFHLKADFDLGKERSHDWDFWGSDAFVESVTAIMKP